MSNLSQFGGGGGPVGSQAIMYDVGPSVTMADGSTWLRAGTLTTAASAPQLAALAQYKVVEPIATLSVVPPGNEDFSYKMASNGANIIMSLTSGYNVSRSADGGASWTTITSGIGTTYRYSNIVYANGRFVMVGTNQNQGNYYIVTSIDGLSWTGFTKSPPGTMTQTYAGGNGAVVVWTGSYFGIGMPWYDSNNTIFGVSYCYTTNGTAQTGMYNGGAVFNTSGFDSNGPSYYSLYMSSNGAGGIIMSTQSSGSYAWLYSTNHGGSWTSYGRPAQQGGYATTAYANIAANPVLIGSKIFITWSSGGYHVYNSPSSTPTAFVSGFGTTSNFIVPSNTTGSKLFIYYSGLQQIYEMDTTNYTTLVSTKQVMYPLYSRQVTSNKIFSNNNIINSVFSTYVYGTDFSNVTYYGSAIKAQPGGSQFYYVRAS